jgi:hypothetical protein
MKKKTIIAMITITSMLSFSFAAENEPREFQIASSPELSLENISGQVVVKVGTDHQINVRYEKEDDDVEVFMDQDGDRVEIRVEYPNDHHGRGDVDFEILFPASGKLKVSTVSGKVDVTGIGGRLELKTVSGPISLVESHGDILCSVVSGSIEMREIGEGSVKASAVSGNVTYKQGALRGGDYKFSTTSGNILISHQADASYRLSAKAVSGGIKNEVGEEISVKKEKYGPITRASGNFNGGDNDLDLNTVSGRITLVVE